MRVRDCHTIRKIDPDTRAITFVEEERWLDIPGTLTLDEGLVVTATQAAQEQNGRTLEDQALQAIDSLRTYRDLASPTNAQTVAAVKLLCRVCIGLIRLALRKFDATD